jgi:hypothetical protein
MLYYVKNGGNDGLDGQSDANAWATIGKTNAISFAAGDQIYFKRGSIFTDAALIPKTNGEAGNRIIFGAYGTGAPPQITTSPIDVALSTSTKDFITFSGLEFIGLVSIYRSDTVIMNYCIIRGANNTTANHSHGIWNCESPGTLINNCLIIGNAGNGIKNEVAAATCTVRNSIIIGNALPGLYNYPAAGAFDVDYCYVGGNGYRPEYNYTAAGLTYGANNITQAIPYPASYRTPSGSYIVFCIDDHDVTFAESIASAFASYGAKLTFSIDMKAVINTAGYEARIQSLHTAGHEIANHSYSHSDLSKTQAFAITSTNTNPTCDVDVATSQIILSCDEGGNIITLSWSAEDKNITQLKAAVAGKGWTITTSTGITDSLKLASLADTAGAQAVPYTALLDVVAPDYAYWREEVTDSEIYLTSLLGVSAPTYLTYPGGAYTDNLIAYLKDVAGFTGGRSAAAAIPNIHLISLPVYKISTVTSTTFPGASEAAIRLAARGIYLFTKNNPCIYIMLAHSAADITAEGAGWLVDEIYKQGGQIVTLSSAIAAIRADHATADDLTYTKVYTDYSNFRIRANSILLRAGADLSLTADILGNTVPAWTGKAPDIGVYENRQGGVFIF